MAYIATVPPEEAEGTLREMYEQDEKGSGYIANHTQAMSLRPEAIAAWRNLNSAIKSDMDLRRYELATIAAASALKSSYCMLAHGSVLRSKFFSPEQVEAIARDYRNAGLEPVDVAIMAYAEKVIFHAYNVTEADIEELRGYGLSDGDILDVALTAAARAFFSKTLDAVGAEPDEVFMGLEDGLRETLAVGRPFGVASAGKG
jgi:uncharacterized peroxidase-related enzyme